MSFCGSYRHDDVQFLLKRLQQQPFIDITTKEKLIQTGIRHYSEMLSPESLPYRYIRKSLIRHLRPIVSKWRRIVCRWQR